MRKDRAIWIGLFLLAGIAVGASGFWLWNSASNSSSLLLYGNVDVRQVDMGFRIMGRVDNMPLEEGDFISQGDFLASIEPVPYSDEVLQAQAEIQAILFSLENTEQIYRRRLELVDEGGVSKEEYENALSARNILKEKLLEAEASLSIAQTNLKDTKIYAPTDGTILTRIREPGSVVLAAEPIYAISIASPVWVRAYIPEPLLGVVNPGMDAEVFTDSKKANPYFGKVGFISPVAEFTPKTVETAELRTDLVYQIRVYVENPDFSLKQGMPVTVRLHLGKNRRPS